MRKKSTRNVRNEWNTRVFFLSRKIHPNLRTRDWSRGSLFSLHVIRLVLSYLGHVFISTSDLFTSDSLSISHIFYAALDFRCIFTRDFYIPAISTRLFNTWSHDSFILTFWLLCVHEWLIYFSDRFIHSLEDVHFRMDFGSRERGVSGGA